MKINLDNIGVSLNELIEANLVDAGLPSCFGKMYPPLLDPIADIDADELITSIKNINREETVPDVLQKISSDADYDNFIMTKEGVSTIKNYKTELANSFTSKITRCINCKYYLPCNNITNNYLLRILLDKIDHTN